MSYQVRLINKALRIDKTIEVTDDQYMAFLGLMRYTDGGAAALSRRDHETRIAIAKTRTAIAKTRTAIAKTRTAIAKTRTAMERIPQYL